MKIGVVCPDRGDRPKFLKNFRRMLKAQTLEPHEVLIVGTDEVRVSDDKPDITKRYRYGYDYMSKKGVDLIAFMENDDWYGQDYLQVMVDNWVNHGKPDIFGTAYTIYYNINLNQWFTFNHLRRSSAMSTLIKPNLNFPWCIDSEPYTDIHLWHHIQNKATFKPSKHICIGIKHGEGMCGGRHHTDRLNRYENKNGLDLLRKTMDKESFIFYTNYFEIQG